MARFGLALLGGLPRSETSFQNIVLWFAHCVPKLPKELAGDFDNWPIDGSVEDFGPVTRVKVVQQTRHLRLLHMNALLWQLTGASATEGT